MHNEDLDCLEDFDTLGDSIDVLEATDPTIAIIETIAEEVIFEPIRDILERI